MLIYIYFFNNNNKNSDTKKQFNKYKFITLD